MLGFCSALLSCDFLKVSSRSLSGQRLRRISNMGAEFFDEILAPNGVYKCVLHCTEFQHHPGALRSPNDTNAHAGLQVLCGR